MLSRMADSKREEVQCTPVDGEDKAGAVIPVRLDDVRWRSIVDRLPPLIRARAVNGGRTRGFLESVIWVATTGQTWGKLPRECGEWHSVYVRFTRWAQDGVWEQIIHSLQHHPDIAEPLRLMVASYLRASHPHRHRHRAPSPLRERELTG